MRTLVAAIFGLLVGVIGGHLFWRGNVDGPGTSHVKAADLAAIGKLHQQDIDVTLTQDPKGLMDIWAEDGMRVASDGTAVVGKAAIAADNAKFRAANPEFKVLKYEPDLQHFSMAVADGWAVETGTLSASFKTSRKNEVVSMNIKALRLLERQPDGAWKFALVELK